MSDDNTGTSPLDDLSTVQNALTDLAASSGAESTSDNNNNNNNNNISSSSSDDDGISYTKEELETMRIVKKRLEEDTKGVSGGMKVVNPRFLAYTVIASKNRVDEAVKKYRIFLKSIAAFGYDHVESDENLWKDPDVESFLRNYYIPCGVDHDGRQIMWIRGEKPIMPHQEQTSVRAGILYVMAIHGDAKSLREGITFVIDTSNRKSMTSIGNEGKLQKMNQSFPLRPQAIYLAGASPAMRIVINGLIRLASFFTKQKVLQRIKFVTLEEAFQSVPKESGPKYLGGGGGNIEDVVEWTKKRCENLPLPDL